MSFKLGMPRITLNPLQTIDDEEAKTIVENEKLILIPDKTNKTGFWYISKKEDLHRQRPYQILPIPEYGINRIQNSNSYKHTDSKPFQNSKGRDEWTNVRRSKQFSHRHMAI